MVLCALVCSGGIGTYALLFLGDENLYNFAFYNFYAVCSMSLLSEIIYRCWKGKSERSYYDNNFKINTVITVEEFDERVQKGENLVIYENMVLDFGDYAMFHPGGKFVLEKNIGRDITKFFYGSYQMIQDEKAAGNGIHTHSV
jgi:hypothetical protein